MCFATFLTRPTLWIALAAILWASLVPSIAQALSLSPDSHHVHRIMVSVDVCEGGEGAAGQDAARDRMLDVQLDIPQAGHDGHGPAADIGGDAHAAAGHGDGHHCPLCRNPHADVGILPVTVPVVPAPVGRAITYPPLYFLAGASLHAWSAVQPRAPPAN